MNVSDFGLGYLMVLDRLGVETARFTLDREGDDSPVLRIPRTDWETMGRPSKLTVTLDPS